MLRCSALIALTAVLAGSAVAGTKSWFESQYQALDKVMVAGPTPKVLERFRNTTSTDFVYMSRAGKRSTRTEYLKMLEGALKTAKYEKHTSKVGNIQTKGNTMILLVTTEAVSAPRNDKDGGLKNQIKLRAYETWKKVGSAWKLSQIKILSAESEVVNQRGRGPGLRGRPVGARAIE